MKEKSISSIDEDEIARFSAIADEWWDLNGKFKPLHRIAPLRIDYIKQQLCAHYGRDPQADKPLEGLSLLDIGCGGGLISEPMAQLGASVISIDASDKNIAVASLHAEKQGLSIDYRVSSPEQLSADEAQFDAVLALEIVEHVADIPAFVHACTQLVKPGGAMVWSTINRTPKSYALAIVGAEYVLRWLPKGTHQWHKFVKPSELGTQLQHEGMTLNHMTGMVMNPLSFEWRLTEHDLSVNYLLSASKAAS